MRVLFLIASIIFNNCLYKTFHSDGDVSWKANGQIPSKAEIFISDDSITETNSSFNGNIFEIERINDKTKKKYYRVIENLYKDIDLFNDKSVNNELRLDFKHVVKRNKLQGMKALKQILLPAFTFLLYPLNTEEYHSVELIVGNRDKIIYKKERVEKTYLSFSIWYTFLLNFYNNTTARDRIFYEQSSVLLKDFYEFYIEQEKSKGSIKPKDKK